MFALWTMAADLTPPIPPPMPRREVARNEQPWSGSQIELKEGSNTYQLFIPTNWKPTQNITLTLHFHATSWLAAQEHQSRGLANPLLNVSVGAGSRVYEALFVGGLRLNRWFPMVLGALQEHGAPTDARISAVDISSFSAGYGAVRQIVQDPEAFKLVRRVVLCDSLYGGIDPSQPGRVPDAADVDVWVPLAKAAMAGDKTFCITVSQVPTDYASSLETATAIVKAVGGSLQPVEKGTLSATLDREFPLLARYDRGHFHVWSYKGDDAPAHLTHIRHLADIWKALDLAKAP